jgi:Major Facilitator Superfamily.
MAFTHQYRFAVAEIVEKNLIPKAISIVLLLSIVGSVLGSTMVNFTKNLVENNLYVGSYICLGFLTILPAVLFIFYQDVNSNINKKQKSETSIFKLLSNKKIQQAITSAGIGYVIMSFLMTATPISMHILNDINLYKTSLVINAHVMGMFLPSLFTGDLIKKFGHTKIIYTGVIIFVFCIFINFIHQSYYNYMIGLILLGIGWNFTFVTGTSLLVCVL